jgi:adenine-specific DNA methylase
MDDKETPRERPSLLIEDWLPVKELGIESIRERAVVSSMPPLSLLHVWWARRPLVASAGVILASVMPTWTPELAIEFSDIPEVSSQKEYHLWVLRLCGILGDPIAAKRAQVEAIEKGARIANPFTYKQAFKNSPTVNDVAKLHRILIATWGKLPEVIDPTAGGGSIPCEAIRYGLPATGNDLNPIATSVLKAGIQIPAQYGLKIVPHLEKYGKELSSNMEKRLTKFFPNSNANEKVATYIFARTVACPRTGKMVPLSPNWWLRGGGEEERVAVRLVTERNGTQLAAPEFEVVFGNDIDFDPDAGTVKRGVGVSPWDGQSIEGDYIKTEAQAGRMGSVLYAVATRVEKKHSFRAPTKTDLDALASAEKELARLMPQWLRMTYCPSRKFR